MVRVAVLVVVIGVVSTLVVPVPAHSAELATAETAPIHYEHPVDAEVIDEFRPPRTAFGPGNRGLEYDTAPGERVAAAGPGVVVFAGQVGGTLHVTIQHPDRRLTSYSDLAEVAVQLHQRVGGGEILGRTRGVLHVGVREDGRYIDPASVFGAGPMTARLIPELPLGGGGWRTPGQEAAELSLIYLQLGRGDGGGGFAVLGRLAARVGGWGGALIDAGSHLLGATVDAAAWLGSTAVDLVIVAVPVMAQVAWSLAPFVLAAHNPLLAGVVFGIAVPLLTGEVPPVVLFATDLLTTPVRVAGHAVEWWRQRGDCTPAGVEPPRPTGRRIAVLVAGLDSTSTGASIGDLDTAGLGYDHADVIGFSYAGGRTPGRFESHPAEVAADLAHLPIRDYGQPDSSTDLVERGAYLADLLEQIDRAAPGTPVDLFAHSQGGVVARLAIDELRDRPGGSEVIESLGLVATMGSPHQGADLATMATAVDGPLGTSMALRAADALTGSTLHPRGTNVGDLARGSDLLSDLESAEAPEGPRYLTLASRGDPIVTDARARFDGARHVTLPGFGPGAHGRLVSDAATTRELALGLTGLAPTCEGLGDALADAVVSEVTQFAISAAGLQVSLATLAISPWDILEPALVGW